MRRVMPRPTIRVQRDSIGWAVVTGEKRRDAHLSKDEALLRARQLVLGEPRARIVVQDDRGNVERDILFGRPSIA